MAEAYNWNRPDVCGFYRTAVYYVAFNKDIKNTPRSRAPSLETSIFSITAVNNQSLTHSVVGTSIGPEIAESLPESTGDSGFASISSRSHSLTNFDFEEDISLVIDNNASLNFSPEEAIQSTPKVKLISPEKRKPETKVCFEDLKDLFGNQFGASKLDYNRFQKNLNRFRNVNKHWARDRAADRDIYYDHFSPKNWEKLSAVEKQKHQLHCEECNIAHSAFQALFPSSSPSFKKILEQNPMNIVPLSRKRKANMDALTNSIYTKLDPIYLKHYGKDFKSAVVENRELKLQRKPTHVENNRMRSKTTRAVKENIENSNLATAIDR